jgi:nucleoside 2-deoxyribosyltransferase
MTSENVDFREEAVRAPRLCKDLGFKVTRATGEWETDLRALEAADLVLANLSTLVIDTDMAWALGYAVARGKTILGIRVRPWARKPLYSPFLRESIYVRETMEELRGALETVRDSGTERAKCG